MKAVNEDGVIWIEERIRLLTGVFCIFTGEFLRRIKVAFRRWRAVQGTGLFRL
jgi:hypothetical protein